MLHTLDVFLSKALPEKAKLIMPLAPIALREGGDCLFWP